MGRTWALGLAIAGLLGAAGCSKSGSYRLSWVFLVDRTTGETQSSAVGCGQHGVDSILVNGTDDSGDALRILALCVPGAFTGTAPPGSWTFTFEMLDAGGFAVRPVTPTINSPATPLPTVTAPSASIVSGGPTAEFPVQLDVSDLSQCNDGIDNDRDGRVDNGGECDAGTSGARDGGTAGDGAQQDGGAGDGGDGGPPDGGVPDGGDGGPQDGGSLDARG